MDCKDFLCIDNKYHMCESMSCDDCFCLMNCACCDHSHRFMICGSIYRVSCQLHPEVHFIKSDGRFIPDIGCVLGIDEIKKELRGGRR